ncbi:transposase [Streptomyces sp. NPDC091259]|uniref:transposase n=1 Tax=Streptomyces sp. NPDC091259 TaxID=3365976 RepID=UPI003801E35D
MPALAPPTLGTDEFAFRKGRTYGTVLVDVDVESARPVDVLPARETSRVATWLQDHPGTEIICRDRLMAFTQAIKQPAPEALEVADRWASRTSRRPSRRPAAGTVTAYDNQLDQREAHRWPHRRLRSWTGSDSATRRSTSSLPAVCRSTPSPVVGSWPARQSGALPEQGPGRSARLRAGSRPRCPRPVHGARAAPLSCGLRP